MTTTDYGNETADRIPWRTAYLLIAQAVAEGLPAPTELVLYNGRITAIWIQAATYADLARWADHFNTPTGRLIRHPGSGGMIQYARQADWHGYVVQVRAYESWTKATQTVAEADAIWTINTALAGKVIR